MKETQDRQAKADEVCRLMADEGLSMRKACERAGVKRSTFQGWCLRDEELSARYARARETVFDYWADQIIDLADDCPSDPGAVQRARLQTDSCKQIFLRLMPGGGLWKSPGCSA